MGKLYLNHLLPTPLQLYRWTPQSRYLAYKLEAIFYTTLFLVVKNGWLDRREDDTTNSQGILLAMDPEYAAIIKYAPKLFNVDFSELFEPPYDYVEQIEISRCRF